MIPPDEDTLERPPQDDDAEPILVRLLIRRRLPGRRLDKYLHGRFPRMSRTAIQRLIKQGAVTVNARPAKPSYEMSGGDVIELAIPPPEPKEIIPEHIPLDIVYEDDAIIAINKAAGIICHPAHGAQTGTLANALVFYANQLSHGSEPFRPGIVHRLDKNTTGIMLVAKTDEAHWRLGRQFENRTVRKTYMAVVEGELEFDEDVIDAPIGVHPVVREKFAVRLNNTIDITKEAVTRYEAAERFRGYTLVKLSPRTGRTHQLRVHMSHIGHPIVGDVIYGARHLYESDLTGETAASQSRAHPDQSRAYHDQSRARKEATPDGAQSRARQEATTDNDQSRARQEATSPPPDAAEPRPLFAHQALHAWRISFMHPIRQEPMELEAPFPPPFARLVDLLRRTRAM